MVLHNKRATVLEQDALSSALIGLIYGRGTIAPMQTMGERIKALRMSRQLSQAALAHQLRITQSAVSQIEKGRVTSLSGETLAALCEQLTTTADYILQGAGSEEGHETAMQIAELKHIMHRLPVQARAALLDNARLLARATASVATSQDPYAGQERRVEAALVPIDRRHKSKQG